MSDDDSLVGAGGSEGDTEPTNAEMERLLLDNLSSGSELDESEEEKGPPRKKRKNRCAMYMYIMELVHDLYLGGIAITLH